jgi:hypothetical protein
MIRKTGHLFAIVAGATALALTLSQSGQAQTNKNEVFASGAITGLVTVEPVTGISIPNKTLFQVQVYKNTYGLIMGRLSYTDAAFNMISSSRVKVQSLTSSQTKVVFLVTYKATTDLLYVTLTKNISVTGAVSYQASFQCTDGYGRAYPEFSKSANMDAGGTLMLTP